MKISSLAGLLALSAASMPASAMFVNSQGTGQLLLFPYYTVHNGQSTILRLHNGTPRAKSLRVQLRESYNGRDTLDFALFLGPYDSWTGSVVSVGESVPAQLRTRDTSCTAPDKPEWTMQPDGGWSADLMTFYFDNDMADTGPTLPSRTHEGYVQVFELAELAGPLADAVDSNGPRNCPLVRDVDPINPNLLRPGGGLSGDFAIVDVAAGTLLGGSATAIDDFSRSPLYSQTDIVQNYLRLGNSGPEQPVKASVLLDGSWRELLFSLRDPFRAIDAVSAVLATDAVAGEVLHEPETGSFTEWVLTAPSKPYHADTLYLGWSSWTTPEPAVPPYEQLFGGTVYAASCAQFDANAWDTEGSPVSLRPDVPPETGESPSRVLPEFSLCGVTDVVYFGPAPASGRTPVLGSPRGVRVWNPQPGFEAGTVQLSFARNTAGAPRLLRPDLNGVRLRGLPLIGFAATKYINTNISPGVLANHVYAQSLVRSTTCGDAQGNTGCP
ncbi:hypothetical protein DFR29_104391 [Tahibacter aquaticus]|uniref:Uncharacterized protein n=1 Tax=Tahibacter aquaticus TaxID=520092 RepID=A0A4R6Z331_9GAMM|nr:hypothetical protein [Tahibacter aquaticus]TDR45954.1 hypothetical protein DFR29_104391 [Tahibacter aquaticus]